MTKSNSAPGITLIKASLRFQDKLLFENLSLALPSASITCLLGPSGVGKTTLLRMLADLPLFGRGDDKLQELAFRKRSNGNHGAYQATIDTTDGIPLTDRVTYMGQTDLLFPWMTVLDNVMLGSYLRGQRRSIQIKARALHILESVGLGAELHHKPAMLSGGMKQRAALARTLMEEKPVVLMDEPFSALDAITRYDMQTLAAEKLIGKTVLLITHDPWEALRLGHQIIVLRGQPAQLSQPILPPESPPRDLTHAALLPLQKLLLNELNMVTSRICEA